MKTQLIMWSDDKGRFVNEEIKAEGIAFVFDDGAKITVTPVDFQDGREILLINATEGGISIVPESSNVIKIIPLKRI